MDIPAVDHQSKASIAASSQMYLDQETSILSVTRIVIFWMVILIMPMRASGEGQDSVAYIFRQDNLSSNNNLQFNYMLRLPESTLSIHDIIRYKVFSYENSITQGEQYSFEHRLRSDLSWSKNRRKSIRLESNQYKDQRTSLASTINNVALLVGYKQDDRFSAFLGGRSVERYGLIDQGWTAELDYKNTWQAGSQRSGMMVSGTRDQLVEHLNHFLAARVDYSIRFGSTSSFQTSLQREAQKQAFFTDSLGSSQSRYNENLQWQNRFIYRLSNNLMLYHQLNWGEQLTDITQEKVNQTSNFQIAGEDRQRFLLMNETGVEFKKQNLSSLSTFRVKNSQNKYYVDYTQVLYQLQESITWQTPGVIDSISWVSSLSRLEYDTPDTTNDDDRDEWRFNTKLRFVWQPSPFYYLDLGSKLSLLHLLYLFNTRSSENHWNRNLVLWSAFIWHRQSWEGEGRARIRSNYFDYDYDDLFIEFDQPTRSFVHRSLDLQQQLGYQFNQRWSITSKLAARWEDEGQLDWKAFIQQVTRDREEWEIIIKVFYDYRGWKGWVGYLSHERLTKYSARNRESELWQGEGPLVGVRHRLGSRLFLDADARFISVKDQDREYLLPKVYITLVYR